MIALLSEVVDLLVSQFGHPVVRLQMTNRTNPLEVHSSLCLCPSNQCNQIRRMTGYLQGALGVAKNILYWLTAGLRGQRGS